MPKRILPIRVVCDRTRMCRSSVYEYEKRGEFPKRVRISARSVGWLEEEVEAFIEARIADSRN